jgi:hypothetical protein
MLSFGIQEVDSLGQGRAHPSDYQEQVL